MTDLTDSEDHRIQGVVVEEDDADGRVMIFPDFGRREQWVPAGAVTVDVDPLEQRTTRHLVSTLRVLRSRLSVERHTGERPATVGLRDQIHAIDNELMFRGLGELADAVRAERRVADSWYDRTPSRPDWQREAEVVVRSKGELRVLLARIDRILSVCGDQRRVMPDEPMGTALVYVWADRPPVPVIVWRWAGYGNRLVIQYTEGAPGTSGYFGLLKDSFTITTAGLHRFTTASGATALPPAPLPFHPLIGSRVNSAADLGTGTVTGAFRLVRPGTQLLDTDVELSVALDDSAEDGQPVVRAEWSLTLVPEQQRYCVHCFETLLPDGGHRRFQECADPSEPVTRQRLRAAVRETAVFREVLDDELFPADDGEARRYRAARAAVETLRTAMLANRKVTGHPAIEADDHPLIGSTVTIADHIEEGRGPAAGTVVGAYFDYVSHADKYMLTMRVEVSDSAGEDHIVVEPYERLVFVGGPDDAVIFTDDLGRPGIGRITGYEAPGQGGMKVVVSHVDTGRPSACLPRDVALLEDAEHVARLRLLLEEHAGNAETADRERDAFRTILAALAPQTQAGRGQVREALDNCEWVAARLLHREWQLRLLLLECQAVLNRRHVLLSHTNGTTKPNGR
ncbi:hypothetical protein A6A25_24445 [Saccharothrix sp. CB00851]|nr:hypothetical protein A6A25_24445 [Saccharothrix sp. CB00851]